MTFHVPSALQRLTGVAARLSTLAAAAMALAAGLAGCAAHPAAEQGFAKEKAIAPEAVYVVAGEGGRSIVRAVVAAAASCPQVMADGVALPMQTRAAPQVIPQRSTQSDLAHSKPSDFSVRVCELPLAPTVHAASVSGRSIALVKPAPQRIVVLGDTGCRIKFSDNAVQDCDDTSAWPFQRVASQAATEHPDLVVHVGDYHYRETACPADKAGCAGSPWGYGWDAWKADVFTPAARLLAAAPWVMARGNHEECSRAGQGWFRLLDDKPFAAERSCDLPAHDLQANFSEPYAIPLGEHWQLIVFDSAKAGNTALKLDQPSDANTFAHYQSEMRTVQRLAAQGGMHSIFVAHHPVLGFVPANPYVPNGAGGNPALLAAMQSLNGDSYFPPGVSAALHGHVHLFEAIDFASSHPATLVTGHGGDNLDNDLPDTMPADSSPAPGVRIKAIAHSNVFGYLVMDRVPDGWTIHAKRLDGSVLTTCALSASGLSCDRQGSLR